MEGPSLSQQSSKMDGGRSPPHHPHSHRHSPLSHSPPNNNPRRISAYDMSVSIPNNNHGGRGSPMRGSISINDSHHRQQAPPQLAKQQSLGGGSVDHHHGHHHGMMGSSSASHPRSEPSFPVKLHQLLSTSDERIIRWQPKNDGKSFSILNCDAFETEVLPRLYRTANIEVFGQLLSLYGFQRVESGPYEGDYYHTMFIKDKPQLAHMIRKGGASPVSNPTSSPITYATVTNVAAESMVYNHSLESSMHATVTSRLMGLNFPGKLHYLLCHGVYDLGLEGVMRWQPGGHAFSIYSSEDFEIQGLAQMLGTPGYASFRAQLSLHGFQRVRSDSPDVEAYYHPDFVREQPQLCRLIRSRNHMKSTHIARRAPSTPTAARRSIVSPLSDISMKSTISTTPLPHSLFVDSPSSLILSPEYNSPSHRHNTPTAAPTKMKSPPPPPPPLVTGPSGQLPPTATTTMTNVEGAEEEDKKGGKPRKRPRVGHMMPQNYFPFKLHSLLTLAEKFSFQNILCWAPHGRCFLVNDKDLFCATVLPLFRHSEFASFRAQLKAYGFVRIGKSGPDKGAYYHTSFLRGQPELCATITRRPKNVNGTVRGRPKGRSYVEPDFYKMKFLPDLDVEQTVAPAGNIKDILEAALTQITPPAVVTREVSAPADAAPNAPATENQASDHGQASINMARDTQDVVAKLVKQNDSQDSTLPVKLHALMNDAHDHSFNRIVTWNDSGRSFVISDEKVFGEILCEKWLNIPSLSCFQTELQMYGFQRRLEGPFKGSYYHEMFHKALPHLCRCIKKDETRILSNSPNMPLGSEQVIIIDSHGHAPILPAAGAPVDSALSTTGSVESGKRTRSPELRTDSPELEVAMALTAMDDRSAEGEQAPVMESADAVSPLTDNEDKTTVHLGTSKLYVPDLPGQDTLMADTMTKAADSSAGALAAPPASAIQMKPNQQMLSKRRSIDPPSRCDMLATTVKVNEETNMADDGAKDDDANLNVSNNVNESAATHNSPNDDVSASLPPPSAIQETAPSSSSLSPAEEPLNHSAPTSSEESNVEEGKKQESNIEAVAFV